MIDLKRFGLSYFQSAQPNKSIINLFFSYKNIWTIAWRTRTECIGIPSARHYFPLTSTRVAIEAEVVPPNPIAFWENVFVVGTGRDVDGLATASTW